MDMRKSTIAAVAEAEKLRKEAGADKMYLEYVFYGLLKIASYRDNPAGAEYRQDAEDLRLFLEMRMRSISSARDKLREEALNGSNGFDATAVPVGRAVEIAGSNQVLNPAAIVGQLAADAAELVVHQLQHTGKAA